MEDFKTLAIILDTAHENLDITVERLIEDDQEFVCFYANTKGENDYREFSYELDDEIHWVEVDVRYKISKAF